MCALVKDIAALSVRVLAVHKDQLLLSAHFVFEALQYIALTRLWG